MIFFFNFTLLRSSLPYL